MFLSLQITDELANKIIEGWRFKAPINEQAFTCEKPPHDVPHAGFSMKHGVYNWATPTGHHATVTYFPKEGGGILWYFVYKGDKQMLPWMCAEPEMLELRKAYCMNFESDVIGTNVPWWDFTIDEHGTDFEAEEWRIVHNRTAPFLGNNAAGVPPMTAGQYTEH